MNKWQDREIKLLMEYEVSPKSVYWVYNDLKNAGFDRTYKAVERKIESLGLRKKKVYKTGNERVIGYLDIESSNLVADFGIMLSWSLKLRDEKEVMVDVITKKDLEERLPDGRGAYDYRINKSLIEALNKIDTVIGYYSTKFDIPFVRARCERNGIEFPHYSKLHHIDCYYIAKRTLKIHSRRLASVAEHLQIKGKSPVKAEIWLDARYGDKKALEYIKIHNINDVLVLEKVHKRLERYTLPATKAV